METISQTLAHAVQHHQAGRLQAAEQLYRQILTVEPNEPDALDLLGVIASQVGKHEIAVQYIGRAIALRGNAAFYHNNLGGAYFALRKFPEAIASYRKAIHLKPDYAEANYNLGVVLHEEGKLDEATACYRRALNLKPDYAEAHSNLGNVLLSQRKLDEAIARYRKAIDLRPDYADPVNNLGAALKEKGKRDEAAACYRRAIELRPNYAEAHYNLGIVSFEEGKLDEASACYRRAIELKPDYFKAHNNLGNVFISQGKLDGAVACYCRAIELKPDYADAVNNLGAAYKDLGKLREAISCYRRAIELNSNYAEAINNLGAALKDLGNADEAVACYRRAIELKPDFAEGVSNLGNALKDVGRLDESLALCRRALELNPKLAEGHNNLGSVLEELGDFAGAEDSFRAAVRINPRLALAHYNLAVLLGKKLLDEDLAAQRRLFEDGGLADSQRLPLSFGLGQALDARGMYAEAANHLDRANALQACEWRNRGMEYDAKEHEALVGRMMAVCTPEFFERVRGFGLDTELPVFIIGLPRSGTTLIEQMLASHSQVHGAGEIKLAEEAFAALGGQGGDFIAGRRPLDRQTIERLASLHLEKLRGLNCTAARIVDKMPENYLFLGLIASMFPRAKIIHCRRDLRDVAISCWMTYFRDVRWANQQQHIASRFQQHERIMKHWRKVMPSSLLEVDYEETVADLEGMARRVVAWCGLEWEPACLEFHRTKRPVRTASAVQVRQPVFKTSVGRWKRYEQALAPLVSSLPK